MTSFAPLGFSWKCSRCKGGDRYSRANELSVTGTVTDANGKVKEPSAVELTV